MQKISDTIGIVLDFLKEVPLGANTVNAYKVSLKGIQSYCEKNSIIAFSHKEAQAFTEIQREKRVNGEISDRYFRRGRRSAFLLANCVQSGYFVWKSAVFPQKTLGEYYANVLIEYQVYISSIIAPSTIKVVVSMIRRFLTVEGVKVSSKLISKRWTTEITARDRMFLEKLGVVFPC